MKGIRKKHIRRSKPAPAQAGGEGGAGGGPGKPDGGRAGERVRGSSEPDLHWKKQLLDGAASVFEGGNMVVAGMASEAQVDVLYRQIGQLKVENDFLARKLGK